MRIILVLLVVLVLGGAGFLIAWEIQPPTAPKEIVVPDDRLGR